MNSGHRARQLLDRSATNQPMTGSAPSNGTMPEKGSASPQGSARVVCASSQPRVGASIAHATDD